MLVEEMNVLFDKHDGEFCKFERISEKLSERKDLHAFILLDQLDSTTSIVVECAEHDQIYLGFNIEEVARNITEDQIIDLVRCGIMITENLDSFCKFV